MLPYNGDHYTALVPRIDPLAPPPSGQVPALLPHPDPSPEDPLGHEPRRRTRARRGPRARRRDRPRAPPCPKRPYTDPSPHRLMGKPKGVRGPVDWVRALAPSPPLPIPVSGPWVSPRTRLTPALPVGARGQPGDPVPLGLPEGTGRPAGPAGRSARIPAPAGLAPGIKANVGISRWPAPLATLLTTGRDVLLCPVLRGV